MAGKKHPLVIPQVCMEGHTLDCEAIPDHTMENIGRVIIREVRKYFSNPDVQAEYQLWLSEYRKTHPTEGGETC